MRRQTKIATGDELFGLKSIAMLECAIKYINPFVLVSQLTEYILLVWMKIDGALAVG